MRILNRELVGMIAFGIAGVGAAQNAFAQTAPDPATPSAEATEMCDPDTPCPPAATPQPQTQMTPPPAPAPQPTTYVEPAPAPVYVETPHETWLESVGLGFAAGGGVDDFSSETMRENTGVGGGWFVRATLGTKSILAFEGSYIGSWQEINALGLDTDAQLVGNGLQGAGRLNFVADFPVQPFAYAGVAWRHYDVTNTSINTSDIRDSDDVAEFPAGLGVSGYIAGFMADVRGEYRFASGEDLAPSNDGTGDALMDRWAVSGSLGFSY
jgi:hypothetical protein